MQKTGTNNDLKGNILKSFLGFQKIKLFRHYENFNADTLYDYFTRQKLSEVEYKGYRILKRDLIKSKRSKL